MALWKFKKLCANAVETRLGVTGALENISAASSKCVLLEFQTYEVTAELLKINC